VNVLRIQSIRVAAAAGIILPPPLPLLDERIQLRPFRAVVDRLLAMNPVAAAAYGFDRTAAKSWLQNQHLEPAVTAAEAQFLENGSGHKQQFRLQVEGMWVLAWAVGLVGRIDFWKDCDSRFVTQLPKLKVGQSGASWYERARMRGSDEILAACDLAYCLHWAVRQSEIEGLKPPAGLKQYIVIERRRALEWLSGDDAWSEITLDT